MVAQIQKDAHRIAALMHERREQFRASHEDFVIALRQGDYVRASAALNAEIACSREWRVLSQERTWTFQRWHMAIRDRKEGASVPHELPPDAHGQREQRAATGYVILLPNEPPSLDALVADVQPLVAALKSLSPAVLRMAAKKMRLLSNFSVAWAQREGSDGEP